jgi:hypothetical protein
VQALGECGLVSRSPIGAQDVYHFRDEYIRNRNLIAWNFYNPQAQAQQVDLLINYVGTVVEEVGRHNFGSTV